MSRKSALAILGGFSLAALLVAIWGVRDLAAALTAMSYCEDPVQIDLSAFWFVGALSISGLPLLSVFHTEKAHKIIFGILVFWFITAPIASHRQEFTGPGVYRTVTP